MAGPPDHEWSGFEHAQASLFQAKKKSIQSTSEWLRLAEVWTAAVKAEKVIHTDEIRKSWWVAIQHFPGYTLTNLLLGLDIGTAVDNSSIESQPRDLAFISTMPGAAGSDDHRTCFHFLGNAVRVLVDVGL